MVYVLLLEVPYEGLSTLGVYSSLVLAQRAGMSYVDGVESFADALVVEERVLDDVAGESFSCVWGYRP
jgi:hypothetical protein